MSEGPVAPPPPAPETPPPPGATGGLPASAGSSPASTGTPSLSFGVSNGTGAPAPPAPPLGGMDIGGTIDKAWRLMKGNPGLLIGGGLVVVGVSLASLMVLAGPMIFGYLRTVQKRYQGEPADLAGLFDGLKDFKKAALTFVVAVVLMVMAAGIFLILHFVLLNIFCLGYFMLFAAGVGLMVTLSVVLYFLMPLAAMTDAEPLEALRLSAEFGLAHIGPMILLGLVTGLIGMAGVLALGLGLFVTVPLAMVIAMVAYNEYYLPRAQ